LERKRIKIKKPHFRFFYILLDREPWALPDDKEIISFIPPGQFSFLIRKEGSQAKATAINIAKKDAQLKEKLLAQGGGIQEKLLQKHGP
jgi:hypothetical protein